MTGEKTTPAFDPCEDCPINTLGGQNARDEATKFAGQRFFGVDGGFDEHGTRQGHLAVRIAVRNCAAFDCLVDKMPIANPQRVELDA